MTTPCFPSEDALDRIGRGFLDRSLPKREWTHAAHFAAALWLMRHRLDLDTASEMPDLIRAYNEATGGANTDTEGYHETITQASLRAARAFLARYPTQRPLHEIANALMASELGRPDWLLRHWSRPVLFSTAARRGWVDPDLRVLPF